MTLALGSQPRQGLAKVRAENEGWESHSMLTGVLKSVKEWTYTLPSGLPLWEWESRWTHEFSKSNFRGQNSLNWNFSYIIEKALDI